MTTPAASHIQAQPPWSRHAGPTPSGVQKTKGSPCGGPSWAVFSRQRLGDTPEPMVPVTAALERSSGYVLWRLAVQPLVQQPHEAPDVVRLVSQDLVQPL